MHELHKCLVKKRSLILSTELMKKVSRLETVDVAFLIDYKKFLFFLYGQWRAKYAGVGMATRCEEGNTRKEERIVDFHAHSRISLALPFLRKITYLA